MKRALPLLALILIVAAGCQPGGQAKSTAAPTSAGATQAKSTAAPTSAGGKQATSAPSRPTPTLAPVDNGDLVPAYPGATKLAVTDADKKLFDEEKFLPLTNPEYRAYVTKEDDLTLIGNFFQAQLHLRGWKNDNAVSYANSPWKRSIWVSQSQKGLEIHMLKRQEQGQTRILVRWGVRAP